MHECYKGPVVQLGGRGGAGLTGNNLKIVKNNVGVGVGGGAGLAGNNLKIVKKSFIRAVVFEMMVTKRSFGLNNTKNLTFEMGLR